MATLVSFWSLFWDRMADLGFIDSKLGLYIKINVNHGQNKFKVHISKNVAKMAILWPKIGQRHFGARASHGHNLAIFHQILTNEHTKMTSLLRRIEWNKILSSISLFYILVFWPHFCSEASHGQCCTYGLKTTLKLLVHVLAIMPPPPPLKDVHSKLHSFQASLCTLTATHLTLIYVCTYIRLSVPLGCLIKQAGIIIHTILNMWETPGIESVTSGLTSVYQISSSTN